MRKNVLLSVCLAGLLFSFTKISLKDNKPAENHGVEPKKSSNLLPAYKYIDTKSFVNEQQIYKEGWNLLPQPKFWRKIIKLSPDNCLVNIASSRHILAEIPVDYYMSKNRTARDAYKDSVILANQLPVNTPIYVTSGKNHYYKLDNALEAIPEAIKIFKSLDVDPFYAQSILLIESPNKLQKSNTGAYGPFQLMSGIARMYGLEVNRYKDDRQYLDKSATAAAKFIQAVCIPETEKILNNWNITYDQKDLWFKLLVLHVYHAGAGNVSSAVSVMKPEVGGQEFIQTLWKTESRGFRNASQNYSQIALAALLELDDMLTPYKPINIEPLPPVFIGYE
ncbi:MAG: hypothetical protein CMO01_02105 [Thalassobius sp.]|nr:hypothetical protein [Thalassovita sp.]